MDTQQITAFVGEQIEVRTKNAGQNLRTTATILHTIAANCRDDETTKVAADVSDRGAYMIDRFAEALRTGTPRGR